MPTKQSGSGASQSRAAAAAKSKPPPKPKSNKVVPIVPPEPIETLNQDAMQELMAFLPREAVASLALTSRRLGQSVSALKSSHPAYYKEVDVSLKGNRHVNNFMSFQRNNETYLWMGGDKNITLYQYQRTPRTIALQPVKEATIPEKIVLSPDGTQAGYIQAYYGLHLIDPLTFAEYQTKSLNKETYALGIHPNNDWYACGSYKIDIWDKTTQTFVKHGLVGYPRRIETILFSPDGRYMVSGGYIGHVIVWEVAEATVPWKKVKTWELNSSAVSLAFSTDGRYLAAGTYEGEITVWDFSQPKRPKLFTTSVLNRKEILRMVFLKYSPILVVHGMDKTVRLLNIHQPDVPLLKIDHCLNMCLVGEDTLAVFVQDMTTYDFKVRFYTNIQRLI